MFFIVNKDKIYAYVVSILTVVILFFTSYFINSNNSDTETTSTNIENNTNFENTVSDLVSNDDMMEN
ncbi:MAG: hypothetical protein ILA02_00290 [Clostridia bacterium]|nr:hypothetical protein [Clostridia bacterium]